MDSGMYRSNDNGNSWIKLGFPSGYVSALKENGTDIFAGTGGGAIHSRDGGMNWTDAGLGNHRINGFAMIGPYEFAGGEGLFLSTDHGDNWTAMDSGLTNTYVLALAVIGTEVFAGTPDGVFRSIDSGRTWSLAGSKASIVNISVLAVLGHTLFVGTDGQGVYHTSDDGGSWSVDTVGLLDPNVVSLVVSGTALFAGTVTGVFRSTDRGDVWTKTGMTFIDIAALAVEDTNLYAGTDGGGIFRSSNEGTSWVSASTGLPHASVNQAFWVSGSNLLASTFYGVYRSTDNGASWIAAGTGLTGAVAFAASGNVLFVAATGTGTSIGDYSSGVYLSTDSGVSWKLADTSPNPLIVTCLVSTGGYLFGGNRAALPSGFFRSSDSGSTWTGMGIGDTAVFTLTSFGTILLAGTYGSGVLLSRDNGVSWEPANFGIQNSSVQAIAVQGSILFAGTQHGLFRSADTGASWTQVNYGVTDADVVALAVCGNNLFAAANDWTNVTSKIELSTDEGNNWKDVSLGPISGLVDNSLWVTDSDLFAGTSIGVWRRPLAELIGAAAVAKPFVPKPELRGYPNPFSQSTTISFTPEASGYADVSVVNLLGMEVARLFSGELAAGERTFTWDAATGDGCATGIYECIVRMNGRVEKVPVMLLR